MPLTTAFPARFEVLRDPQLCISCGRCIQECSHGVHQFYKDIHQQHAIHGQIIKKMTLLTMEIDTIILKLSVFNG